MEKKTLPNKVFPYNLAETMATLGIRPVARRIIELLLESDPMPASNIAVRLTIPRPTVYDALRDLSRLGLLVEYNTDGKRLFGISDTRQLVRLHEQKVAQLQGSSNAMAKLLPLLQQTGKTLQPKVKFYSGPDSMAHALNDIHWKASCKETYLMWPMQEMIDAVGEDFLKFHSEQRLPYNILLRSIRKDADRAIDVDQHSWLRSGVHDRLREVRYAPSDIDWSMSYWIYDTKCLFATKNREQFAFIVDSQEFADLMKILWQQMWTISKE